MNCPSRLVAFVTGAQATGAVRFVADHSAQSLAQAGHWIVIEPGPADTLRAGLGRNTAIAAELALVPHALAAATW